MESQQQDLNESLPLPNDKMPECWEKDDRMNSLFAQFRNRSVNPQDWDSKYRFWRQMISDWSKHKMRCSFSLSDLNKAFKRNGRTPACLSIVIQELHRNGEIVSAIDFVRESPSTWGGWAVDTLVKRPFLWSFSVIKSRIVEPTIDAETKYVQIDTVKELGELILSTLLKSEENALRSLSELSKNCAEKIKGRTISEEDMKLALIWLRHNKKAAFRNCSFNVRDGEDANGNEMLIKLSNSNVKEVTEVEEGIYNLEKQEKMLIKNLELLELEKETVLKSAKAYLSNGMKQVAKSCLRKKNELEKSIEKRSAQLLNVQILVARVKDAHSDSEVFDSYKTGAAALKKKLNDTGMTEDNVIDTMNDLSEVLEEFGEIQSVLTKPVDIYDSELEEELSELLAESSETEEASKTDKNTPLKPKNDVQFLPGKKELPDLTKELSSLDIKDFPSVPKISSSIKSPVPSQGD